MADVQLNFLVAHDDDLLEGSDGSDLGSVFDGETNEEPEAAEEGLDVNNMDDDDFSDVAQNGEDCNAPPPAVEFQAAILVWLYCY